MFRAAIDKDPSYASAYAGLAESYVLLGYWTYVPAKEFYPNALALAKRAIELDNNSAEAHCALGLASLMTWQWTTADRELQEAIELNANLSLAHLYRSWYFAAVGNLPAAKVEAEVAIDLDPLSIQVHTTLESIYMFQGDYAKAIDRAEKSLQVTPDVAVLHYDLFAAYAAHGILDKAAEDLVEGYRLEGRSQAADALRDSYRRGGFKTMLRKRIQIDQRETIEDYDPYGVAASYALLKDKDNALEWLNRAVQTRSGFLFIKVDDNWTDLRADPRFADLLGKMGLAQ